MKSCFPADLDHWKGIFPEIVGKNTIAYGIDFFCIYSKIRCLLQILYTACRILSGPCPCLYFLFNFFILILISPTLLLIAFVRLILKDFYKKYNLELVYSIQSFSETVSVPSFHSNLFHTCSPRFLFGKGPGEFNKSPGPFPVLYPYKAYRLHFLTKYQCWNENHSPPHQKSW